VAAGSIFLAGAMKMEQALLQKYVARVKDRCGSKLDRVILFGSYARGDAHVDSDIDIMILLSVPQDEIHVWERPLNDDAYDFNMQYDIDIEPVVVSCDHFRYWTAAPFYQNVLSEGVVLYDAAA